MFEQTSVNLSITGLNLASKVNSSVATDKHLLLSQTLTYNNFADVPVDTDSNFTNVTPTPFFVQTEEVKPNLAYDSAALSQPNSMKFNSSTSQTPIFDETSNLPSITPDKIIPIAEESLKEFLTRSHDSLRAGQVSSLHTSTELAKLFHIDTHTVTKALQCLHDDDIALRKNYFDESRQKFDWNAENLIVIIDQLTSQGIEPSNLNIAEIIGCSRGLVSRWLARIHSTTNATETDILDYRAKGIESVKIQNFQEIINLSNQITTELARTLASLNSEGTILDWPTKADLARHFGVSLGDIKSALKLLPPDLRSEYIKNHSLRNAEMQRNQVRTNPALLQQKVDQGVTNLTKQASFEYNSRHYHSASEALFEELLIRALEASQLKDIYLEPQKRIGNNVIDWVIEIPQADGSVLTWNVDFHSPYWDKLADMSKIEKIRKSLEKTFGPNADDQLAIVISEGSMIVPFLESITGCNIKLRPPYKSWEHIFFGLGVKQIRNILDNFDKYFEITHPGESTTALSTQTNTHYFVEV